MENYLERCGMCVYCDLSDKNSWSGAFKCKEYDYRVKVTEEKCKKFKNDNQRTFNDIEYARSHENGLRK